MRITRPKLSRIVGFGITFLSIFGLVTLLGGQSLFDSFQTVVLMQTVGMIAVTAVLSWHYTIFPLRYNLWLFPSIGIAIGVAIPMLLGGYGIYLIPLTVPIFGLITTLGPKLQDLIDRLPKLVLYILLLPSAGLLGYIAIYVVRLVIEEGEWI